MDHLISGGRCLILEETLRFLLRQPGVSSRHIRSLHLNDYFTVVDLDDGSVGVCMSPYRYKLNEAQIAARQSALQSKLCKDPLLLRHTESEETSNGLETAIRVAVANALSAPILRSGAEGSFVVRSDFPHHLFVGVQYAVILGFPGILQYVLRETAIPRVHVSDLWYHERRAEIDPRMERYRRTYPDVDLSISDGSDSQEHLRIADFVSITGSALGNGTLNQVLPWAENCKKIIVQGQSASIYPGPLFAAGVQMIVTTFKTREVAKAAFWDPTGHALRPLLEGGLPWIYLWPKLHRAARQADAVASV